MESMSENWKLKWLLILNFFVLTSCIFNTSDELRELFELVPYPSEDFKMDVIQMLLIDLAFCYGLEYSLKTRYLATFKD